MILLLNYELKPWPKNVKLQRQHTEMKDSETNAPRSLK